MADLTELITWIQEYYKWLETRREKNEKCIYEVKYSKTTTSN